MDTCFKMIEMLYVFGVVYELKARVVKRTSFCFVEYLTSLGLPLLTINRNMNICVKTI